MKFLFILFTMLIALLPLNAKEAIHLQVPKLEILIKKDHVNLEVKEIRQNKNDNAVLVFVQVQVISEEKNCNESIATNPVDIKINKKESSIHYFLWSEDFKFNQHGKNYTSLKSHSEILLLYQESDSLWSNKEEGFKLNIELFGSSASAELEAISYFEGQRVSKINLVLDDKIEIAVHAMGINLDESYRIYYFESEQGELKSYVTIFYTNDNEEEMPGLPVSYDIRLKLHAELLLYTFTVTLEEVIKKYAAMMQEGFETEREVIIQEKYLLTLLELWFSQHPEDLVKH